MTKIKFCGLSRTCDIENANELKPDYIGFVFAPKSRRYVTYEKAAELKNGEQPGEEAIYTAVTAVKKENMYDPDIQKILFSFKKG